MVAPAASILIILIFFLLLSLLLLFFFLEPPPRHSPPPPPPPDQHHYIIPSPISPAPFFFPPPPPPFIAIVDDVGACTTTNSSTHPSPQPPPYYTYHATTASHIHPPLEEESGKATGERYKAVDVNRRRLTGQIEDAAPPKEEQRHTIAKIAAKEQHVEEGECVKTGNPMDDCWRCSGGGGRDGKRDGTSRNWEALQLEERKRLAGCAMGFGRDARGGVDGDVYVVTEPGDHPVNPLRGSLRHAVIQVEPLWIVFESDMVITLAQELLVGSHKTIDGRGRDVHVAGGGCLTLQNVSHVIVHGIHVHDCRATGPANVRSSPTHVGWRTVADGDAISLFGASHVWIDHCSLSRAADGLIDAVFGSTAITISNNLFSHHDKVMLLGHSDAYGGDKGMQVTIAFNRFAQDLVQRMPRCRHGFFEIVNNDYRHWEMYAIGGSAAPTINSKGNRYIAPANPFAKDVTMRMGASQEEWEGWDWRSEGDMLVNGAYFTQSGALTSRNYERAATIVPRSSSLVGLLTADAGALSCSGSNNGADDAGRIIIHGGSRGYCNSIQSTTPSSYFPGQSYSPLTSSSNDIMDHFYHTIHLIHTTLLLLLLAI